MCGILGFIGNRNCVPSLVQGLKNLEYRGYDSSGIAINNNNEISITKRAGKIVKLEEALTDDFQSKIGIAHTRWATHGVASERNAHPHYTDKLALVHNGIIENYEELKNELLKKGYEFTSSTDSEVIAWLITDFLNSGEQPEDAILKTIGLVHGSYAIAVIFKDDCDSIYCIRDGSPLALGVGEGEMFLGSDALAISHLTDKICYLEEGDLAILKKDNYQIIDTNGNDVQREVKTIKFEDTSNLGDFDSHMLKEIFEQPKVLQDTVDSLEEQTRDLDLSNINRIVIIACGTSYHAGCVAQNILQSMVSMPIETDIASEFKYRNPYLTDDTLAIFISQSGETADTISAIQYCKERNIRTLSVSNVYQSTISRITDNVIFTKAGAEIGVASTKAFTTQVMTLTYLMAKIAKIKNTSIDISRVFAEIIDIPNIAEQLLSQDSQIEKMAHEFIDVENALYIGRGNSYNVALEGALKLKEISYMHAQAYPAGEMKHGPIALIDEVMPTVAVAKKGELFEKTISNIKEIQARKGRVILVTDDTEQSQKVIGERDFLIEVPECSDLQFPIIASIPLQLFAYHVAKLKGHNVDQPRNLAKSVTVE